MPESQSVIDATRRWVDRLVVGENLCPFAKRELVQDRVRFAVSGAQNDMSLLEDLGAELERLLAQPELETTLLIHPQVLTEFLDFNDFLGQADELLRRSGLEGVFQLASFHPHYQFAGTDPDDAENYTNRSPYPVLHLLREALTGSRHRALSRHRRHPRAQYRTYGEPGQRAFEGAAGRLLGVLSLVDQGIGDQPLRQVIRRHHRPAVRRQRCLKQAQGNQ